MLQIASSRSYKRLMPQTDEQPNYLKNFIQKKVMGMLIIAFSLEIINFELHNLIIVLAYHLL